MVQSDALSHRPDLCPDDDTDNENIIMLLDDMFLNLIDLALQEKITNSTDLDNDATDALKLLLDDAPRSMTAGLTDWTIDKSHGKNFLFYKGKQYIP